MPLESSNDPALREALVRFLLAAFRMTPEAPFVQPSLLRRKYDVLGRVAGQIRIADIWVNSGAAADWSAAIVR